MGYIARLAVKIEMPRLQLAYDMRPFPYNNIQQSCIKISCIGYYRLGYKCVYHHHHHTVQVTILCPITTTTTTTTAQAAMHAFSICATALRKKTTTSASYCVPGPAQAPFRGSEAASPLLACTMQQAHVSLHKGVPLNWGSEFNGKE